MVYHLHIRQHRRCRRCGKMLKLDQEKSGAALGIASSLSGGLRENFGTMTKPLHAGNAARNGVVAGTPTQSGFTADRNILDNPLSFCQVLDGKTEHQVEVSKINRELGREFYVVSPGIALKLYPSCAYSHWAIDATFDLKREATIDPSSIVEIECRTSSGLPHILIHSRPTMALEAKFSLEFCVAIALVDGEVSLKRFSDEKVTDPAAQELMRKIKYVHHPEMESGLDNLRCEVVVKLQNGRVYSRKVDIAKGDPKNPLSREEINKKYIDCARLSLSPEDTHRSLNHITS